MHVQTQHQHPEAAQYAHHYNPLDDKRRGQLLAFRLQYKGQHTTGLPSIFANCLVYRTQSGMHHEEAALANEFISRQGLQLIAQPTTLNNANTFTVQFTGHA